MLPVALFPEFEDDASEGWYVLLHRPRPDRRIDQRDARRKPRKSNPDPA